MGVGYWKERQEAMYLAGELQVQEYFKSLEKAFHQAKLELHRAVNDFYVRYATENGITYVAAMQRLNKAEIGALQDFITKVYKNMGKYSQEVNNMSIKARITRYQALEAQVDAILQKLYATDYETMAQKTMREIYQESYYHTWYNIDCYRGFHSQFAQIEPRTIEALLMYPFDGANFSDRIWKQKAHLQAQLMESITTMLIQGKNPQTLVKDFSKKMKSKQFDAYRILHTESSFLISQATHKAYKEDGILKYQILATLDSKTCDICGGIDSKIFDADKAVVGVTMPPFHCFCRCTDTPYYDDMDMSDTTRAARDPKTGNVYNVPANMTYKEWVDKYKEGGILSDTTDMWAEEARKELLEDEKALSARQKETAVVYGPDGQFLFQRRGDESEVSFTIGEFRRLMGCTVSHNHPSGGSFSARDIYLLYKSKAAEIRVITDKGVYFMRRPDNWPQNINTLKKIKKARDEIANEIKQQYQDLYKSGRISKAQRFQKLSESLNKIFAERYGIEYGKDTFEN